MKQVIKSVILIFAISILMMGCQSDRAIYVGDDSNVALLISNKGDMAFNDAAIIGLNNARKDFGVNLTILEHENKPENFEPMLIKAATSTNQIIFGSSVMKEAIENQADNFPDSEFILYDAEVDWTKGKYENVYCVQYASNEGAYLAGYIAANMSKTGKLGFIGGYDRMNINANYVVGYIAGAQSVNKDIEIMVQPLASIDKDSGREVAKDMINSGCDIIFSAASTANQGIAAVAGEEGILMIGSDADQAMQYETYGDKNAAKTVITSVMKNVTSALYDSIARFQEKDYETQKTDIYGLWNEGVGLADNDYYQQLVPVKLRTEVRDLKTKIVGCEIKVPSALEMTEAEIQKMVDDVQPK